MLKGWLGRENCLKTKPPIFLGKEPLQAVLETFSE
jgi:hypothetical protein